VTSPDDLSPPLDPGPIFEALNRHEVDYVLIGGYAAQQHGAIRPTKDIDVTPSTELENLGRLAAALKDMGAGIRVNDLPQGLPFDTSAEALRGVKMLNLRTPHGDFDLTFAPAGIDGYLDLARSSTARSIEGCDRAAGLPRRHHPIQNGRRPRQGPGRATRTRAARGRPKGARGATPQQCSAAGTESVLPRRSAGQRQNQGPLSTTQSPQLTRAGMKPLPTVRH